MEYFRTAGCSCQSGTAGIGEQVQHPDRTAGSGHLLPDKVPVGSLLREDAGMLEVHGLDVKGQVVLIFDLPALRQIVIRPAAAAGIAADITGIIPLPLTGGMGCIPNYLGIRTHQA